MEHFCLPDSAVTFRKDLDRLKVAKEYEGKPLVFHALRHTFSTMLADAGLEDSKVSALLGHREGTVAAKHYIARNLQVFYGEICKMPLDGFALKRAGLRLLSAPARKVAGVTR